MALTLVRSLQILAAEKKAVMERQSALIASLNRLLPSIGYRLVPVDAERETVARPRAAKSRPGATSAARPLICPHCHRTFALPLHLGRHISVTHKTARAAAPAPGAAADATSAASTPAVKPKRGAGRKATVRRRPASPPKRARASKAKRKSVRAKTRTS